MRWVIIAAAIIVAIWQHYYNKLKDNINKVKDYFINLKKDIEIIKENLIKKMIKINKKGYNLIDKLIEIIGAVILLYVLWEIIKALFL